MESFKEYQIERRPGPEVQSRHEWVVDGDELKLDIHGNIETIDGLQFTLYRTGERTTSKIRIRARMEQLLRRLGINAKFRPSDKRTSDISLIWDDGGEKSGKLIIYRPEQETKVS